MDWALRAKPLLETEGWTVVLTRTNDVDLSLPDRVVIVFALIAVKRPPIILGSHVMNSSARTAGIPWQGSKRSHNS